MRKFMLGSKVRMVFMVPILVLIGVGTIVTGVYASNLTWIDYIYFAAADNGPFIHGIVYTDGTLGPIDYIRIDPNINDVETYANKPFMYLNKQWGVLATHVGPSNRAAVGVTMESTAGPFLDSPASTTAPAYAFMKSSGNSELRVESSGGAYLKSKGTSKITTLASGDVIIDLGN